MSIDEPGFTRRMTLAGLAATALASPARASALVADRAPDPRYRLADGRIRIVGTDIMRIPVTAWNRRFTSLYPGFAFALEMAPGLMAIGPAAYDTTPFVPMPRLCTRVELESFRDIAGRDPLAVRVGHGSVVARDRTAVLAIYVHHANPLVGLTVDQLAGIFSVGQSGGDITCWGQMGLDGEWARRPIHPIGTPMDTGFGSYMVEQKFGGRPLTPSMIQRAISTDVIGLIENDIGAIGYAAVNFGTAAARQIPISTNASGPWLMGTAADVTAGTYPLDRFIYLYVLPRPDGTIEPWIGDYLNLVLSAGGQALVSQERDSFLSLNPTEIAAERRAVASFTDRVR